MKITVFLFIFFMTITSVWGQTQIFVLDFENPGGYTTSMPEQNDGSSDYFTRTDGSDISATYNNPIGSYFFAAQDLDADGMSSPATLTINDIDISGYTNLELRVYLAEEDVPDEEDWDNSDYLHIDYDIDNSGSFSNGIWVENDGSTYNSAPFIDTDYDGTGDGQEITDTFTQFTKVIAGTGSTLDIKITFGGLTSSDEDIAIDHIEIYGTPSGPSITVTPTSLTGFSYIEGSGPSAEQSFTVEGSNLTGDITITPPANWEISTSSGGPYQTSAITLTQNNGTVSQTTIYTRLLAGLPVGNYSGNIACSTNDGNGGTLTENIAVEGTVTYSNQSDIIANTGFSYTVNIPYVNYQADPITNTSHSVGVFKFDIRDGGDNADADNKPTELTDITFSVGSTHGGYIRAAALFNGNTHLADASTIDAANGTITFSGLSGTDFTAPDDGIKSLTLRVSFTTQVTDNEQLQFTITSATANTSGSVFGSNDAGGAQSAITGDKNRIEVIATKIAFTTQPVNGTVNTNLNTFTVSALDDYNNKDLDATNSISLTTSGTGMTSSSPYTMSGGKIDISDVQFDTPQTGITITATTTGLATDNDDVSDPFDILDVVLGSYRTTSDGTWHSTSGSGTATWEEYTSSGWTSMSGQPSTSTSNPVYIRHNISLVGTNTASDITIENNGILNTNGVSQTLTKLLVKNGGTYFKNSNGVRVADGGIIEVENGGTFKFKHTNGTNLSTNLWNGTEKFHEGSNFIIVETDNTSNFMFMPNASDVSNFNGGQFGNLIIDLEDGKLMLLPENYSNTLTKNNLILKKLQDNVKFTQTNATCTIKGDLIIENTVNKDITITTKNKTVTINIEGNFEHKGSEDFRLANSNSINPNIILNIDGNLTLSGNSKLRPDISSNGTGINQINLKGNLTVGSNSILYSENNHSELNFVGNAGIQTIDIATSDKTNQNKNIQFNVKSGAKVECINQNLELGKNSKLTIEAGGTYNFGYNGNTALLVTKSGSQTGTAFDLNAGGYLKITSSDGIMSDSSAGNVQVVPSNTTFSPFATFHYIGKTDQVTGDAIGNTSNGKAVIVELASNNLTLTPSNEFGITNNTNAYINNGNGGILDIRKGKFIETETSYITGSTGGLSMSDGTYYKIVKNSNDSNDLIPRLQGLSNTYNLNGSSTIELGGDGTQTLRGGRNYRNLTFSNAGLKTISSATPNITGDIYITDNATLNVENKTMGGANTNLIMDTNAQYITAGTGTKPDAEGDYLLEETTKITFNNNETTEEVIRLGQGSPIEYANIDIDGSSVANASLITGIRMQSGTTFTVKNGATFKLKNTAGFNGATNTAIDSTNNPTITLESGSTIEYYGDSQTITPFNYKNLQISGSNTKTIGHPTGVMVEENLNVLSSELRIEDDKSITIQGNITNNGQITVEHAGSLVQTASSPGISNGHYVLNKTASHLNHYYDYVYWSTPFNSGQFSMGDLVNNAWAYYYFDPSLQDPAQNPDPGWKPLSPSDNFDAAKGYAISAPNGFTGGNLNVSFETTSGKFNTGNIQIPITINGAGAQDDNDWNLIGNPYPSAIDFDLLAQENNAIGGAYYAWTNCAGLDANGHHQPAGYTVYSTGSGSVAACSGSGTSTGQYINSAQGFFVEGWNGGQVTFKNAYRVPGNNNHFIGRQEPRDRIWIDLTNDTGSSFSQILIGFFPGATDGKDRLFDAHVMGGYSATLYSINNGEKFTIQGYSPWNGTERRIPIGIHNYNDGEYILRINRSEGILQNVRVYLHDLRDNSYHDLTLADFRTFLTAGTYDNQFELVFSPRTMQNEEEIKADYFVGGQNGLFRIHANNPIKIIRIYDLNGRLINQKEAEGNLHDINLNLTRYPEGTYLLQIIWQNGQSKFEKIIR